MRRWSLFVVAIYLCACDAVATSRDWGPAQEGAPRDIASIADVARVRDSGPAADLPAQVGDPCLGLCAADLLCLAGQCHAQCTPTEDLCNDKTPPCRIDERCLKVSDFANACIPATPAGGVCGSEEIYCAGGSFCVDLGGGVKRCLGLCKYGCDGQCVKTVTECEVCVE